MLNELSFTPNDAASYERAERAARFCGAARAMIENLTMAGLYEKVSPWEHERDAWQARLDEASSHLSHEAAVEEELRMIGNTAYSATFVSRIH